MDRLTLVGLFAVTALLVCSAYGFLRGVWPFGLVEGVRCLVALDKWRKRPMTRGPLSLTPP